MSAVTDWRKVMWLRQIDSNNGRQVFRVVDRINRNFTVGTYDKEAIALRSIEIALDKMINASPERRVWLLRSHGFSIAELREFLKLQQERVERSKSTPYEQRAYDPKPQGGVKSGSPYAGLFNSLRKQNG